MFERYNQPARRVLFATRYEAGRLGGSLIESEHLVLGILTVRDAIVLALCDDLKVDPGALCEEATRSVPRGEPIPTAVEIPFSADIKRALICAASEADQLEHQQIDPGHLLLGILRDHGSAASTLLRQHGMTLRSGRAAFVSCRQRLEAQPPTSPTGSGHTNVVAAGRESAGDGARTHASTHSSAVEQRRMAPLHIGLIGGIGPAATDFYYRRLIAAFARRKTPLELTIVHADTPTLLANLVADDKDAQVAIYTRLTARLQAAGAECVVVTSVAGHFCISEFEAVSPLPVINLLPVVDAAIRSRGRKRVGVLGTRVVMESRLYGQVSAAQLIPPPATMLEAVHDAYVSMAAAGQVTTAQRAVFDGAVRHLVDESGVDAILLGGTDLALVYGDGQSTVPLVDAAGLHVEAIVARACP